MGSCYHSLKDLFVSKNGIQKNEKYWYFWEWSIKLDFCSGSIVSQNKTKSEKKMLVLVLNFEKLK